MPMTALDFVLVAVAGGAFAMLVSRPVRNNREWSATVTPLASIIGSGFLVSVPLMASAVGLWALPAVAGLTLATYLIGAAIRYNIRHGEPVFENAETGHAIKSIEGLSHLVLVGAYFVTVAYYLVLLGEFGMKLLGWDSPGLSKVVGTVLVSGICAGGALRGLGNIEKAEKYTVSANLAAIAALLACLVVFNCDPRSWHAWSAVSGETRSLNWDSIRFLMGLLIIVQGFETTRFMGQMYDPETRIRAMRRAQVLSSLVYVAFFILMVPLFPYFTATDDVAGVIGVVGRIAPWLPFVVTAGAIASQFSAAVADSIGASGLVTDITHRSVTARHAYLLIGAVSILVIWETSVVSLVALSSRAFALFFALQCIVAHAPRPSQPACRRLALRRACRAGADGRSIRHPRRGVARSQLPVRPRRSVLGRLVRESGLGPGRADPGTSHRLPPVPPRGSDVARRPARRGQGPAPLRFPPGRRAVDERRAGRPQARQRPRRLPQARQALPRDVPLRFVATPRRALASRRRHRIARFRDVRDRYDDFSTQGDEPAFFPKSSHIRSHAPTTCRA